MEDQWYNYGKWSNLEDDAFLFNKYRPTKISDASCLETAGSAKIPLQKPQIKGLIKDPNDYSKHSIAKYKSDEVQK